MYALPEQTAAEAEADVRQALELEPSHLSQYHLTIEPGTLFAAAPPSQPADDIVEDMLSRSLSVLSQAGFAQYEVSGYAREGAHCAHNLNYWQFGDYLGVGAGAHGKLTLPQSGTIVRTQQWREPRRYLAAEAGALTRNTLTTADLLFEFSMNGFRLIEGFDDTLFADRTGVPPAELERALSGSLGRGLVTRAGNRWSATAQGFRFLNEILVDLLPDGLRSGRS
jgi:oxygen-independent coproporphyrinogen-3 oxidase